MTRRWTLSIVALCLLVVVGAWWVYRPQVDVPARHEPGLAAAVLSEPVAPVAVAAPKSKPATTRCMDQRMEITVDGVPFQQCLGATHTVRNGSILTHRADPQDPDGRWLNIEVGGKTIFAAQIGTGGRIDYQCERDKCSGIAVGPYDAQGARIIVLSNAALFRESTTHPGEQQTALVTGQIRVMPDDQSASTACVEQVLLINIGNETVHFCPDGGTGFDLDEDGGKTYRFTNGDGASVAVDTDPHEALRRVEYNGYSCLARACGGVSVSEPSSNGTRHFSFRGTMLVQGGADGASALLNGNLILDPQ